MVLHFETSLPGAHIPNEVCEHAHLMKTALHIACLVTKLPILIVFMHVWFYFDRGLLAITMESLQHSLSDEDLF